MPNPNNGTFSLKWNATSDEDATLHITDVTGRGITQFMLHPNKQTEIRLNVPPGIYYLTAHTKNGTVLEKIVVE